MMQKITLVVAALATVLGSQAAVAGKPFIKIKDLNPEEKLGRSIYKDDQLSLNRNQSCESCHTLRPVKVKVGKGKPVKQQSASFVDPDNVKNGTPVSDGSDPTLFGTLNAPSAGYAAFSPAFHWDPAEGLYFGGQFWNGRSLFLRDQAKGPFTNPVEMAMPDRASVIARLQENPDYLEQFISVYGIDLAAVQTDGTDPEGVQDAYHAMSLAIEAFERSAEFNRFNSKFDFVETATYGVEYTDSEARGADLFDAVCAACHEGTREIDGIMVQGLMTDFSYDNIGTPAHPGIPVIDEGLFNNPMLDEANEPIADSLGKQKVMSLRNIELTPPYMHNGVLLTLEKVVHFYNTRDVLPECTGTVQPADMGEDCWPVAAFPDGQSTEVLTEFVNGDGIPVPAPQIGNMGMTLQDEKDLVVYLKTFTDSYPDVPKGAVPGYQYNFNDPLVMPERPPLSEGSDR